MGLFDFLNNDKKVLKDIQHLGITFFATGVFELSVCQIIEAKVNIQGIKIFNDTFSKTLVTIIQDVLSNVNSLALGTCVVAIIFIAIYVVISVNKKTKENLHSEREI